MTVGVGPSAQPGVVAQRVHSSRHDRVAAFRRIIVSRHSSALFVLFLSTPTYAADAERPTEDEVSLPALQNVGSSGAPARRVYVFAPDAAATTLLHVDGAVVTVRDVATWLGTGVAEGLEASGFRRDRVLQPGGVSPGEAGQVIVAVSIDSVDVALESDARIGGRIAASVHVGDGLRQATRSMDAKAMSSEDGASADDLSRTTAIVLHDAGLIVAKEMVTFVLAWANDASRATSSFSSGSAHESGSGHTQFPGVGVGTGIGIAAATLPAFFAAAYGALVVDGFGPTTAGGLAFAMLAYAPVIALGGTCGGALGAAVTGEDAESGAVRGLTGGGVAAAIGGLTLVVVVGTNPQPNTPAEVAIVAGAAAGAVAGAAVAELGSPVSGGRFR